MVGKCGVIFFIIVLLTVVAGKTTWDKLATYSFEQYVVEFNKHYSDASEYNYRNTLFTNKLQQLMLHNSNPSYSWKVGVNQFTDMTYQEFSSVLGYDPSFEKEKYEGMISYEDARVSNNRITRAALPASVDWRDAGIITAVKNQGMCGSCWTFGTAENIESYWANKTGQLTDLSEQQILDCTPNPNDCGGTGGCGGGTAEIAYEQILKQGGLATEWTYPYQSYYGSAYQCRYSPSNTPPFAKLTGFVKLPSNVLDPVMNHLATVGPLVINVDASAWSEYESGVFDGCNQVNPDIDHVVQLVGYGTTSSGETYWLVRNSWSAGWGENGYIRLRRTDQLRCGVDLRPQDGTGCNGGPETVIVCGTCGLLYAVTYPVVA